MGYRVPFRSVLESTRQQRKFMQQLLIVLAVARVTACGDGESMADYDRRCEQQYGGKPGDSGSPDAVRKREIAIADCKARLRGYKNDLDRYRRER